MDPIKALTGKNPAEYEPVAKVLVDKPDIELFKKLVKQDDFLFDFIKSNVAKRIQKACNKDNFKNLFKFFDFYSPFYADVFGEVIHKYRTDEISFIITDFLHNGSNNAKAYALKCLSFWNNDEILPFAEIIRDYALNEYEPISINATNLLAKIEDSKSKQYAIDLLSSDDEFKQFSAVKFLVNFQAIDVLPQIISIMKKSSLAENIAAEIPYLIPIEELIQNQEENANLILCYIISSIPDIIDISSILDFNLLNILETLYYDYLSSSSALVLKIAKDKFGYLTENEDYLFDCDKNTKEEVYNIKAFLDKINPRKLDSLMYDELYEESDFVLFAVDYTDDVEELETLLESKNQTLLLKVLTNLKEKNALTDFHKEEVLKTVTDKNIIDIVNSL